MKLYYSPGACSLAPHIALHEMGLPFTAIKVDLKSHKTTDGTDYYTVNPKGYVPTLEISGAEKLTEAAVVLQYIADRKPNELAPAFGTMERYRLMESLNFIATELHKQFGPLWQPTTPEATKEAQRKKLAQRFETLSKTLAKQPYVTGDKFIDYLANQLRATPYCTNLPKNIKHMFDTQRYDFIADSWISSMEFSFPASGPAGGAPADAMFQSVFAANDTFYARPIDVITNILRNVTDPSFAVWLENSFVYREPSMVGTWPVEPLPASVRLPTISSTPTMMLVGSLDVATPSIFSRPSEPGFSNHVYYEIVSGHATAFLPCVLDMLEAWFVNPGAAPGNRCPQTYTWDPPAGSSTPPTLESTATATATRSASSPPEGWAVDRFGAFVAVGSKRAGGR